MRKIALLLSLVCALGVTACKSHTEYGECVGLFNEDQRDPNLRYQVSTRNVVWTIIFSETLVVPVVWAVGYSHCPVGRVTGKKAE